MVRKENVKTILREMNGKNIEEVKMHILKLLYYRFITKSEYLLLIEKFKIKPPINISTEMILKIKDIPKKRCSNILKINKLNYFETKFYIKSLLEKGLKREDLIDELYELWDDGYITGFDYRYILEILGEEIPPKFIEKADLLGRYTY